MELEGTRPKPRSSEELSDELASMNRVAAVPLSIRDELNLESSTLQCARIEQDIISVVDESALVTERLFAENRSEFERLAGVIEERMNRVEVLLVRLRACAKDEYVPPSIMERIAFTLLPLNRRVATLRAAHERSKRHRQSMLTAANDYEALVAEYRAKIECIRFGWAIKVRAVILDEDDVFQSVLEDIAHRERRLAGADPFDRIFLMREFRADLEFSRKEKVAMEKASLERILALSSREEFDSIGCRNVASRVHQASVEDKYFLRQKKKRR